MYPDDPMMQDHHMQQQQQQQSMSQMDSNQPMMMMDGSYGGNPDYMEPMNNPMDFNDPYNQPSQQQLQDNYYMDSEYGHNESGSGAPSRQDSVSSLDRNLEISVKKIEVMEDEYGKMKMALLSDLDQDPDHDPAFFLSPCVPQMPPPVDQTGDQQSRPSHPPRQRSRDNLESIFGGGGGSPSLSDRPSSLNFDGEATSNSQLFLNLTTESRSSDHNTTTTTLMADVAQSYLSSSFDPDQHEQDFPGTRTGPRNNLILIEEPFPVCVSPEMELSISSGSIPPLSRGGGHIDTIEEVPEEEDGSPTTGDGVSRRRTGRKSIPR
jgi:hypothetical protein